MHSALQQAGVSDLDQERVKQLLSEADLNHDGVIDAEEFVATRQKEKSFPGKDRKLTREEWIALYGDDDRFDQYDLNHDGIIDPEEWIQMQVQLDRQAQKRDEIGVTMEVIPATQSTNPNPKYSTESA